MNDFNTQMEFNITGDAARQGDRIADSVDKSGRAAVRAAGRFRRLGRSLSNGIDRLGNKWTGFGAGVSFAASARGVIDLEKRLKDIEVQAGRSGEEMLALKNQIFAISQDPNIRIDPRQLVGAFDAIIEKTGDFEMARDNLENMAVAIRATGAMGEHIGAIMAGLKKIDVDSPRMAASALETLTVQGKAGAFTMQHFAREAGPLLASLAAMGQTGDKSVRFLGAMAQVTQMATDNAAETSTAIQALMRDIAAKGKELEKRGITIFDQDALAEGKEQFLDFEVIVRSIMERSEGRMTRLTEIFGEEAQKAVKVLAADFQANGSLATLDQFLQIDGDQGQLAKDAAEKATTMAAALDSLNAAWQSFGDRQLSEPIRDLADALNSLNPDQLNQTLDIAADAAKVAAGFWALNKGIRLVAAGSRALSGMRGGRAAGKAGAAVQALSAQPVFVTNWPGSMQGLGSQGGATTKHKSKASRLGRAGRLAKLGGVTKHLGKAGWLGAILGGVGLAGSLMDGDARGAVGGGGAVAGGLAGAKLGGAAGLLLGPLGAAIGALAGGGLGALGGEELTTRLYDLVAGNSNGGSGVGGDTAEAIRENTAAMLENTRERRRRGHPSTRNDDGHMALGSQMAGAL